MLGPQGLQRRIVRVVAVSLQVQRQVQPLDRLGLRDPRPVVFNPRHPSVQGHPGAELPFPFSGERQPRATVGDRADQQRDN